MNVNYTPSDPAAAARAIVCVSCNQLYPFAYLDGRRTLSARPRAARRARERQNHGDDAQRLWQRDRDRPTITVSNQQQQTTTVAAAPATGRLVCRRCYGCTVQV